MTEVPEHLLRRSRERREALGLGGGGEGAPAAEATPAPTEAAAPPEPEAAGVPAVAEPLTPAVPTPVLTPPAPPEPPRRVPMWMAPVLLFLPFWAFIYVGTFGERESRPTDPVELGELIYEEAGCGACHGPTGAGTSSFPKLSDGEAVKTFPEEEDHIEWVRTGSIGKAKGTPYGDEAREGGQHTVTQGNMPAFADVLDEEEIEAVVAYEREGL